MINDIKLGLKVIRYGLNVKGCVIISVVFLLMGILMDFVVPAAPMNGLYIGMGTLILVQTICSVSVSTMVQTSSLKRRLQTSVPSVVGGLFLLLGNTVSILVKFVGMKVFAWSSAEVANGIVITAVLIVIIVLYMSGAMKVFWPATISFFIIYLLFFGFSSKMSFMTSEKPLLLSIEVSVVLSYVMIIAATALMYFIFVATYKRNYSKQNFETQLRRAK
ncbi:MAG: hypothetical protein J6I97_05120 [Agathobacter sp.]|nr:hypothetical protein [Agathobacter sp.]